MAVAQFFSSFEPGEPGCTSDRLTVDNGPPSSPTARPGAGFTGLHALRYAGTGELDETIFELDLLVQPGTELSYRIFPASRSGEFAGLDLLFEDGSRLTDYEVRDQHGIRPEPAAQGASATLWIEQWNHKSIRLDPVAGKRITAVRFRLATAGVCNDRDRPAEQPSGWIDDVRIGVPQYPVDRSAHPSELVRTLRGTHSSGDFSRGNNIPATAVPHGFNFLVPVTDAGTLRWLHEYHRANNERNLPELQAFAISHQPSPWMADRQTLQLMPVVGAGVPSADRQRRAMAFRREHETARPHRYAVEFENGVSVEMAPTDHAAVFRFRFPDGQGHLLVDNVTDQGAVRIDADTGVISGYSDTASPLSVGASRFYFHATVDATVIAAGTPADATERPHVAGYLSVAATEVTLRIGTSLLSPEQAEKNLRDEVGEDGLDQVADAARRQWDELLGIIEVAGATDDQLVTLYSNLYRLFLYPNSGFELTGDSADPRPRYASPVSTPPGEPRDGTMYVNNGFWDTYRTTWPAYVLFTPDRAAAMIDGFVRQFTDGGWISRWSSPGYANLMTGTSSDAAFADAYVKGVRDFDVQAAWLAGLANATVRPPNDSVGRKGLSRSIFRGYTDTDVREGFSWAIEGYLNDAGLAAMAAALGHPDEELYFADRALGYARLFDERIGFFQGRDPDGGWRQSPAEYTPTLWGYDYTETNGWNMAFSVQHDGVGLANLYGGREALAAKLDEFLATPETGTEVGSYGRVIHEMTEARDVRMGQYAHSNQPSHHILYMYAFAGRPDRTQQKVREVLSRLYLGSEIGQGYPGDEDNGEMSAWWLFSALGFYPLQVGSPTYVIGSPLFERATVHLPGGRELVIEAPGNNAETVYVKSLTVNGEPWRSSWIDHEVLAAGGVLRFEMSAEPTDWATHPGAEPPALSAPGVVPRPMYDLTSTPPGGSATGTAPGSTGTNTGTSTVTSKVTSGNGAGQGFDPSAWFDDDSLTEAVADGPAPWIQVDADAPAVVRCYTLTSGAIDGGDPSGWRLSGSSDGTTWQLLDRREDEVFRWRGQTRPFRVPGPQAYRHYRLEFDGPVRLAEVELLAE